MSDWNFGEVFNSSLMRGLAENAEKEKYQQEFAYRDERAKTEDSFKQMQFKQLVSEAEKSNAHNIKMEGIAQDNANTSRLSSASREWAGIGADSPVMKYLGKNPGINEEQFGEIAGPAYHPSGDKSLRYVNDRDYQAALSMMQTDRLLAVQQQKENQVNAPLNIWSKFVGEAPAPILNSTQKQNVTVPGDIEQSITNTPNMMNPFGDILGFLDGHQIGEQRGPDKIVQRDVNTPYINPDFLNKFGDTYYGITLSGSKSNLASQKADEALAVLDRQFNSFNKDGANTDQLMQFIQNMDKWGYKDKLNPNALIALDALVQRRQAQKFAQGKFTETQQSKDLEQALQSLKLREAQKKATDGGY